MRPPSMVLQLCCVDRPFFPIHRPGRKEARVEESTTTASHVGTMLIGCAMVRCTFDPRSAQRSGAPAATLTALRPRKLPARSSMTSFATTMLPCSANCSLQPSMSCSSKSALSTHRSRRRERSARAREREQRRARGRFDRRGQFAPFRRLRRRCGRLDRLQVGQVVVGLGQDVDSLVKAFLLRAQSRVHGLVC